MVINVLVSEPLKRKGHSDAKNHGRDDADHLSPPGPSSAAYPRSGERTSAHSHYQCLGGAESGHEAGVQVSEDYS
jgi:hypothetical protein